MHRGSSKGARTDRAPEILPLSAPPAPPAIVRVELETARAGRSEHRVLEVASGTTVRQLLRSIGQPIEGCAVLDGERPVPSDEPLVGPRRLTIVPTFSGG